MVHKPSLPNTLLLSLVFSLLLSSSLAVPSTRSIKKIEENPSSLLQNLLTQEAMDMNVDGEELADFGKVFIVNGRMDLESKDYPGTGANNHHDPKTPGRA